MIGWIVCLLAAASAPAPFDILGIEQLVIDAKTEPEAVRLSKQAERTEEGFRLEAPKASLRTQAIPGGLAWRPPHQAKIAVKLTGELDPNQIRVSVRYSTDGRRWSDWIPLALQAEKPGKPFTWRGEVKVEKRSEYEALLTGAWLESQPRWRSDEDELCRWIAKNRPAFFEKQIPVIGWLECRVERLDEGLEKGANPVLITKLELESAWAVGGLHVAPPRERPPEELKPEGVDPRRSRPKGDQPERIKPEKVDTDYGAKWHFRLPEPKKTEDER